MSRCDGRNEGRIVMRRRRALAARAALQTADVGAGAEGAAPAPVRMIARTPGSSAAFAIALAMLTGMKSSMEFMRSGRLSVTVAMRSFTS